MNKSTVSKRIKASVLSLAVAVTAVSASIGAVASNAVFIKDINTTVSAKGASLGTIAVDGTYTGYMADLAESGLKTISITCVSETSGGFSYGFGIGIKDDPYWVELNPTGGWDSKGGGTSVTVTAGEEFTVTIDVSSLDLSYTPSSSQYPGKFEFRNYYGGPVSIVSVKGNDTSTPVNPGNPKDPDSSGVPSNNKKSGAWSFVDNKDGTATISSTVTKQIDGLDMTLTKGYDEDYYAAQGTPYEEGMPINSFKASYKDLGITDMTGVTIESVTATIESDVNMATFMYGGGINVQSGSPADTEYAKRIAEIPGKETAGYWYNDMGEEEVAAFEAQGVEFGITVGNGVTVTDAGTYYEAYWEVPAEVQEYLSVNTNDGVSFQFWYGEEEAEEYTELTEVTLKSICVTYTQEVTVPYSNTLNYSVGETIDCTSETTNSWQDSYANIFGVDPDNVVLGAANDVYAVKFNLSAGSDVEKLVYSIATSVNASIDAEYWFQESDFVLLNAEDSAELMWIVPTNISGATPNGIDVDYGNLFFGYWYGASDTIDLDSIDVYYNVRTVTAPTEPTTEEPTEPTTEPTTKPNAILWGDANCDGIVTVADVVAAAAVASDPDSFSLSAQGAINADVHNNGDGVSALDASVIQEASIGLYTNDQLPVS